MTVLDRTTPTSGATLLGQELASSKCHGDTEPSPCGAMGAGRFMAHVATATRATTATTPSGIRKVWSLVLDFYSPKGACPARWMISSLPLSTTTANQMQSGFEVLPQACYGNITLSNKRWSFYSRSRVRGPEVTIQIVYNNQDDSFVVNREYD